MGEYQGDLVVLKKMSLVGVTAIKRQKLLKFTGKPARFHSEVENGLIQLYEDKNRRFFSVDLGSITKSSTFMNINIDHVLLEYIYEIE